MSARDNAVVVVTGGTRGIGAGLGQAFLGAGLRVAACGRSEIPVKPEAAEPRYLYRVADVADAAAIDAFSAAVLDRFGRIDVWVNNAGVLEPMGMFRDLEPAEVERHVGINVLGVMNGSRAFLRHLHDAGRTGTLINVTSGAAKRPYAGWSVYCAAKAAVDHFTRVLVEEERGAGHRIFALAPGVVNTDMQALIRAQDEAAFPAVEKFRKLHEDDNFVQPERSAKVILELAFGDAPPDDPVVDVRDAFWDPAAV